MNKPDYSHTGVGLRDYFAANAPATPEWFRLTADERCPPVPAIPDEFTTSQRDEFVALKDGQLWPDQASEIVREFHEAWRAQKDVQDEWRQKMKERKFFAWRWHYADRMLSSRSQCPVGD